MYDSSSSRGQWPTVPQASDPLLDGAKKAASMGYRRGESLAQWRRRDPVGARRFSAWMWEQRSALQSAIVMLLMRGRAN